MATTKTAKRAIKKTKKAHVASAKASKSVKPHKSSCCRHQSFVLTGGKGNESVLSIILVAVSILTFFVIAIQAQV
jgi:hypothetical protein